MRKTVLLDHCVDRRLKRLFSEHEVKTAREMYFENLSNGELLAEAARAGFDAVVTVDQNLKHQQNLTTLPVAVVVIAAPGIRLQVLANYVPEVERVLSQIAPCSFIEVSRPEGTPERGR